MNKDVIYIEPEQDITDILANIKASKHKIIALVPPKKAGVLRSAVNFKLIAKTAKQNEKTVVLITADESLRRLAGSVAMPIAKSLQSKPQLPSTEDAEEFGEEDDTIEEPEAPKPKAVPVAQAVKVTPKKPATPVEDDIIEGEPEPEEEKPKTKNEKNLAKMKGAKIPNIKKYRKFIIIGAAALVVIIVFSLWANLIAPYAKISVKVHTTAQNFTEKVTFVEDESKADAKAGIFFLEKKTVTKKAEGDFEATGEVDKGTKASGTVTITLPAGKPLKDKKTISIPKDATFTINGKIYVVTEGKSIPIQQVSPGNYNEYWVFCSNSSLDPCSKNAITSGSIPVVAKENGDSYNVAAATSGISSSVSIPGEYTVSSTAMTGGSSKIVKVVSKEDVEGASSKLITGNESNEARDELKSELGDEYILLGNMDQGDPKITTSPNLNEEVGDNVTPKIIKEVTYTMYAVNREQVKTYITEVVSANLGDDTQEIYDTGIDKAFFEAFQNSKDDSSAKLKTTTKTGPRVTDEMIREKALGKKTGEVQSLLKSIKGVSEVKVNTSYFFVTTVPDDTNKVEINIENEE
ncbi:hypothetical protein IKF25_03455 [Candidatus Saccharibacteria bacterium]|nr:hypothetical protein [Candidatus Saccharibacteria bacterium]